MNEWDEPIFDTNDGTDDVPDLAGPSLRDRIQALVDSQAYGVLCVQGGGQPTMTHHDPPRPAGQRYCRTPRGNVDPRRYHCPGARYPLC